MILRIEDTDLERSTEASTRTILEGLEWLGITWDEGPFYQSREIAAHRALALRFLDEGKAYHCFCTAEELDRKRKEAETHGSAWKYDRTCLRLEPDEVRRRLGSGQAAALRFRVPEGPVAWVDAVHGETSFDASVLEDIILLRSNGSPTYNLSCVSDDIVMRVTHVIRGDDHISNTPKQILIYRGAGAPVPTFAHLPLILGADKKRLSKRHGAVSVTEYRDRGILPEALFNFLALLGWSPGEGREKLTRDEMVAAFDLAAINRKGAVFDEQKLEWINSQYINELPAGRVAAMVRPDLERERLWSDDFEEGGARRAWFLAVCEALKARSKRMPDFARDLRPFLSDRFDYQPEAVAKHLTGGGKGGDTSAIGERLGRLREALARVEAWTEAKTEEALRALADSRGEVAALYIHPLRVALLGTAVSPGIFTILVLIGRERALARIDRLVSFLRERTTTTA